MYVRFFDVDVPNKSDEPVPLGVIDQLTLMEGATNVIPVVYITNRTFLNLNKEAVTLLALNVFRKVNSIFLNYNELQIDCDWSEKTKENYFAFLKEIKHQLMSKKLSCTIRLHQIKYPIRNGIPEVDRGMLMFYNIGTISDPNELNSIYNPDKAKKYTAYIKSYALPLDAVLPVFKWYVHFRNNKVIGLISKKQLPNVSDTLNFTSNENTLTFKVKRDLLEKDVFYKKNDLLRLEELSREQLIEAAELLSANLRSEERRIALYDLDELNINNYETKTFKEVFSLFD